jgi:hypothetical protein
MEAAGVVAGGLRLHSFRASIRGNVLGNGRLWADIGPKTPSKLTAF